MFKSLLSNAEHLNWMGIPSLLTFTTIFVIALVLVFTKKKEMYEHLESLPLEDGTKK